jgi:hypothetical protein
MEVEAAEIEKIIGEYKREHSQETVCPFCNRRFAFPEMLEPHKEEECLPYRIFLKRQGNWRNA